MLQKQKKDEEYARLLLKSHGQGVVGVLAMAVLVGIVSVGVMRLATVMNKQQQQTNTTFQISQVGQVFARIFQDNTAWNNTINDPSNITLSCLQQGTDCTGQGGNIRALDVSGNPVLGYDPLASLSNGFTNIGAVCNSFNATIGDGNDFCPFRLNLSWQPQCTVGVVPCINPQAKIIGQWAYNPKTPQRTIAFNGTNYGFTVVPGQGAALTVAGFVAFDGGNHNAAPPGSLPGPVTIQTPPAPLNVATVVAVDQPPISQPPYLPACNEGLITTGYYLITWAKPFSANNYPVSVTSAICGPNATNWYPAGQSIPPSGVDSFPEIITQSKTSIIVKSAIGVGFTAPCNSCASGLVTVTAYDYQ